MMIGPCVHPIAPPPFSRLSTFHAERPRRGCKTSSMYCTVRTLFTVKRQHVQGSTVYSLAARSVLWRRYLGEFCDPFVVCSSAHTGCAPSPSAPRRRPRHSPLHAFHMRACPLDDPVCWPTGRSGRGEEGWLTAAPPQARCRPHGAPLPGPLPPVVTSGVDALGSLNATSRGSDGARRRPPAVGEVCQRHPSPPLSRLLPA